jgi:hypothetical protein
MKLRALGLFLVVLPCGCYITPWANTTRPVVVGVVQKDNVLMVRTCKIWVDVEVGVKLIECKVKEVENLSSDNKE